VRHYYEDRQTGSIYSASDLARLLVRQGLLVLQMGRRFEKLPYSTCCLLEEAEAVAARADQGWHQGRPER
jgi:hypothetical protein